ncbi:ABC transporter substrate-binding protein [Amphritea sp.]|uniref:ABC transporter substrate-binding protein n=1 Tax=Amphritea sp. TaxID=1872502 RepID=UPI003D148558
MIRSLFFSALLVISIPGSATEIALGASEENAQATVGCLFPMSGRSGLYGRDSVAGIQLALEHLAQESPPDIRVLIADSSSKVSKSARQVRDFIRNDNARFICGVVNSVIALQVVKITEEEKVFFIGTDHASSRLTDGSPHPYYFRMTNNTKQSMLAAASYIREKFGQGSHKKPLRLAYIGPDYEYGYQAWEDLRQGLKNEKVHYEVSTALWPKLYEPDYSTFLRALLNKEVDLVVNTLWGGDLVAFIQQANQTELFQHARFANFETGGSYEVLSVLGQDMPPGLILSSRHHNNWPETDHNRWFVERFFELNGRYPSYAAEGAYSGILAISKALQAAGPEASDKQIRDELATLKLKLPEDPQGFSSFMDPVSHQLQQVIAIGETVPDQRFPPARMALGNWHIYKPAMMTQPDSE